MEKNTSEVLVDQLVNAGVQYVFGIPGHTCLGVVDALRKNKAIEFITVRHEETGALMASAYAKLTDKLGVCLTIAGPGATNLLTGLYDAKMDKAPVLAITGQVDLQFIRRDVLQEIDQHSLFEPVSVFNKVITTPNETAEITLLAIKNAMVKNGVAHLGVPRGIQSNPTTQMAKPVKGRIPNHHIRPDQKLVKNAIKLINSSSHPMIIVGWGARYTINEVLKLAAKIAAPIATTFKAKGLVSERHPQSVGVLGSVGSRAALNFVKRSDLLIVLGSSFSRQTNIPSRKAIIQVDYDPMVIGKRYPVKLGMWGSIEATVPILRSSIKKQDNDQILKAISAEKKQWQIKVDEKTSSDLTPIHPGRVLKALQNTIPKKSIISIDAGDNSFWFGKYFQMDGQRLLLSGYLATMGFAFSAALGAAFARPDWQSICLSGDGGFAMVMGDFTTAVKYDLPVKAIIFNNQQLAMIIHEQRIDGYPPYGTELLNPDFAEYAKSCGGLGYTITQPDELEKTFKKAFESEKPCLIDVHTSSTDFWKD